MIAGRRRHPCKFVLLQHVFWFIDCSLDDFTGWFLCIFKTSQIRLLSILLLMLILLFFKSCMCGLLLRSNSCIGAMLFFKSGWWLWLMLLLFGSWVLFVIEVDRWSSLSRNFNRFRIYFFAAGDDTVSCLFLEILDEIKWFCVIVITCLCYWYLLGWRHEW